MPSLKIRNKAKITVLTCSVQYYPGVLVIATIQGGEKN
jgi:multisubunit Na+/H+ antiporter MnhE subunit